MVTASSKGIGYACARALALEGARICLSSRSEEHLREAKQRLAAEAETDALTIPCDMSDPQQVIAFCRKVSSEIGPPDILVNNTGGPKPGGFFDLDQEDWDVGYRLMMLSTVVLYRELIPGMRRKGWGRIVNITSTSSRQPIAGLTLSNSFRPGILGLAKTVADDVAADGVLIMTVMPGMTMTERMTELSKAGGEDKLVERLQSQVPLRRAADPAELGNAVAFLCSEKASFITGSVLAVDGGSIRCI